jgi:hypothetical protein
MCVSVDGLPRARDQVVILERLLDEIHRALMFAIAAAVDWPGLALSTLMKQVMGNIVVAAVTLMTVYLL